MRWPIGMIALIFTALKLVDMFGNWDALSLFVLCLLLQIDKAGMSVVNNQKNAILARLHKHQYYLKRKVLLMSELQQTPQHNNYDDEIDLFELWGKLWTQRLFIISVTSIVFLIAVVYLLVAKPIYRAEAYFLAPLKQDIRALNIAGVSEGNTPEKVYSEFQKNLQSRQVRREFFDNKKLIKLYGNEDDKTVSVNDVFEKKFNKDLIVTLPKKDKGELVSIYFDLTNRSLSAPLLNEFIQFSAAKTVSEFVNSISADVKNRKEILGDRMSAMRKLGLLRRQDRIIQLEESLRLAAAADIVDTNINESANKLNMDYMRGTTVIESEIKILKSRKNDDAFIPELRNLEERYSYLTSINLDKESIKVAAIDQHAYIPEKPIKPKKLLVLAISIVLGGMLGIMLAFMRSAIQNRKESLA